MTSHRRGAPTHRRQPREHTSNVKYYVTLLWLLVVIVFVLALIDGMIRGTG
ncbi:hypothetical protein OV450_3378 [Actinobacteria bacterium OV450]|nr:hypothetical protein OV450_3378 [Actinobacteria bacterium OV450]